MNEAQHRLLLTIIKELATLPYPYPEPRQHEIDDRLILALGEIAGICSKAPVQADEGRMKVWVLCQNDFPVGVVSSEESASAWRQISRSENARAVEQKDERWAAFHYHAFDLDDEP